MRKGLPAAGGAPVIMVLPKLPFGRGPLDFIVALSAFGDTIVPDPLLPNQSPPELTGGSGPTLTALASPDFSHGDGLLPAIAQDAETGEILMLAYMNAESYRETLATGRAVYFSRSRGRLWRKGEESGHWQEVRAVLIDCDADTILLKVRQIGGGRLPRGLPQLFLSPDRTGRITNCRHESLRSRGRVSTPLRLLMPK